MSDVFVDNVVSVNKIIVIISPTKLLYLLYSMHMNEKATTGQKPYCTFVALLLYGKCFKKIFMLYTNANGSYGCKIKAPVVYFQYSCWTN